MRIIPVFFVRSLGALLILMALLHAGAEPYLRVGIYNNSPKVAMSESGEPEGIFIDLIEEIAGIEGWRLEYVPGTWAECLDRLESAEIDLMPDVALTPSREAIYSFHDEPALSDWFQVYAPRGSGIRSVLDLRGKRVSMLERSIQQEAFGEALIGFDLDVILAPKKDFQAAFAAVAQGEADAVIANRFYGSTKMHEHQLEDTAIIFSPTRLYFAAPKGGDPAFLEAIDRHLLRMKKDPASIYYRSLQRWTSEDIGIPFPRWFQSAGIAAVILLSLILFWSFSLRIRVESRTRELALRNEEIQAAYEAMEQSKQALFESELKHRTLFETANDAILLMRQDRFIDCNAQSLIIYGCRRDQIIGASPNQYSPLLQPSGRSSADEAREKIRLALTEGPQFFEWQHCRHDGTPFMAEVSLNRLELGEETLLQAIVRDITQRKEIAQALFVSEEKYRSLVEHANSIILRWTNEGRITFLNEYGLQFFGYTAKEIIGRHVVGTIVPSTSTNGADLQGLMDQICADPVSFEQNENENVRRNGERVWVSWTNHIEWDEQHQVAEILSVGTDITARKQAEEKLRRSEEQFRLIMENLADLVAVLDLEGRRLYNSPSYGSILGNPDKLRGTSSFESIHPDDLTMVQNAFRKTAQTGLGHRLDYRLVDQSGHPRYIESQGSVIRDSHGQISQVVVVSRDITERRQAEQEIRELNVGLERRVAERTAELAIARDRAEAADRLKSAFLATMSHELRTPLNSIIGFTGILLQELAGPLNAEQHKQLDMVRKSSRHLLTLINDVLDISKIEAGQLEVCNEPFDLRLSIEKVIGIIRPMSENKNLLLRVEVQPEIDTLVSDERRVEQILINLLNNAVKFTEQGEVTLRVEALSTPDPAVRFQVLDTGIGISPEDMSLLFQPFRQIDSGLTRTFEGTGLGLAICRRLADLMGGEIFAESAPGEGSVFTFTLPMNKVD